MKSGGKSKARDRKLKWPEPERGRQNGEWRMGMEAKMEPGCGVWGQG